MNFCELHSSNTHPSSLRNLQSGGLWPFLSFGPIGESSALLPLSNHSIQGSNEEILNLHRNKPNQLFDSANILSSSHLKLDMLDLHSIKSHESVLSSSSTSLFSGNHLIPCWPANSTLGCPPPCSWCPWSQLPSLANATPSPELGRMLLQGGRISKSADRGRNMYTEATCVFSRRMRGLSR